MSIEKVMNEVLQPAEAIEVPAPGQPPSQAREPAAMSDDEFERHLVERMNVLLEEADARKSLGIFAHVAAWKLAEVGHHCGRGAVGNIVRLVGANLEHMAEAESAQREAEQARKDGHRPN